MSRKIFINGLRISCHVGVPDEEIAVAQELSLDVVLTAQQDWTDLLDDIAKTIDYAEVVTSLEGLAQSKPRRLIETLAVEIADFLLENYSVSHVSVKVIKMILPQTSSVAVMVEKNRRPE
jgi:dihydroneopterin aldolase